MIPLRQGSPLGWSFHWGTALSRLSSRIAVQPPATPGREDPAAAWTPLPPGPALLARTSCRWFSPAAVSLADLAALVRSGRGAPSAGGLYPLEVSVIVRAVDGLPAGVHHYVPAADGLEVVQPRAPSAATLASLFLGQRWVADAAAVLVLSARTTPTLAKYGDRGYRYLLLEAGHVAQNLALAAAALGLGAVQLGGFLDDDLARLLRLDTAFEVPLYGTAVGHPALPPS
jgi:SagB-type dehydrogenase family enzyme